MLDEKRKQKVDKIHETAGFQNARYDVYEAGMADGVAQGPVLITIQEARKEAIEYYKSLHPKDPLIPVGEINGYLAIARRYAPEGATAPAATAENPNVTVRDFKDCKHVHPARTMSLAGDKEYYYCGDCGVLLNPPGPPVDFPCEYCGPVCYGGAEHNARVEDGAKKAAPVQDDELAEIACKAYSATYYPESTMTQSIRRCVAAAISAVRPQIETQMLERIRASVIARSEGSNLGGDIVIMKAIDAIEVARNKHWILQVGLFRKALENAGLNGHYSLFQIYFAEYIDEAAALVAAIEAAARVGYRKQEDVEKALVDEVYFWGERQIKAEPHAFFRCVCARFTPTPEPVERVEAPIRWVDFVVRREDMSPDCIFRLQRQQDGDVIITILSSDRKNGFGIASIEFCAPMTGGGSSENTWNALLRLAQAMESDNQNRPQIIADRAAASATATTTSLG